MDGRTVTLEEIYSPMQDGRLSVETCMRGQGLISLQIQSQAALGSLCRVVDRTTMKLNSEVELGGRKYYRSGKVVGPATTMTFAILSKMATPCEVQLQYDDVRATIIYEADGWRPTPPRLSSNVPLSTVSSSGVENTDSSLRHGSESLLLDTTAWKRSRHLKQWRQRRLALTQAELTCFKRGTKVTEAISICTIRTVRSVTASEIDADAQGRSDCLCIETANESF